MVYGWVMENKTKIMKLIRIVFLKTMKHFRNVSQKLNVM